MRKRERFDPLQYPDLTKEFHFNGFTLRLRYGKFVDTAGEFPDEIEVTERKLLKNGDELKFKSEFNALRMLYVILEADDRSASRDKLDECLGVYKNKRTLKKILSGVLGLTENNEDFILNDGEQGYRLNKSIGVISRTFKECAFAEQIGNYEADDFVKRNSAYIEQIAKNCRRLSEAEQHERWRTNTTEFRIALARATLQKKKKNGQIIAKVEIPENPFVAFTKEQRRCMEYADHDQKTPYPACDELTQFLDSKEDGQIGPLLMRMSAGGCIAILRCPKEEPYENLPNNLQKKKDITKLQFKDYQDHIVLTQKDAGSQSYTYDLSPASGIAEKEEDWTNPLLVVAGEFAEEIRIIERKSKEVQGKDVWYYPKYNNSELDRRAERVREIRKGYVELYQQHWQDEIPDYLEEAEHTFIRAKETEIIPLGKDQLRIRYASTPEPPPYEGLLVIDPQVGALDLMWAVRMRFDIPLSMLSIMDGEAKLDQVPYTTKENMKLLNRNIFAFTPPQLRKLFEGKKSKARFFGKDDDDRWTENVEVELGTDWQISPPGFFSGIALLKNEYKYGDLKRSERFLSKNEKDKKEPTKRFLAKQ